MSSKLPSEGPWYAGHGTRITYSKARAGTGNDQLGVGFYFTDNEGTARGYGAVVHEVSIRWRKVFPNPWKPAPAVVRALIRALPEDWDHWDWDEDPRVAKDKALRAFLPLSLVRVLGNLPGSFTWYRDEPYRALDVLVGLGYTGFVAPAGSTTLGKSDLAEQWAVVWDEKAIVPVEKSIRRPNPRPLPLEEDAIGAAAQEMVALVEQALLRKPPQEPLGDLPNLAQGLFSSLGRHVTTKDPIGDVVVRVTAEPSPGVALVNGGGAGTIRIHGERSPVVIITLNGRYPAEYHLHAARRGDLLKELRLVLGHEIRHLAQHERASGWRWRPPAGTRSWSLPTSERIDFDAYLNDPAEMESRIGDLVNELREIAKPGAPFSRAVQKGVMPQPMALNLALGWTDTWREVEPHLTKQNRERMLRAAYQELRPLLEQAAETYAKKQAAQVRQPNPRPVPLDEEKIVQLAVSLAEELDAVLAKLPQDVPLGETIERRREQGVHAYDSPTLFHRKVRGLVEHVQTKQPIDVDILLKVRPSDRDSTFVGAQARTLSVDRRVLSAEVDVVVQGRRTPAELRGAHAWDLVDELYKLLAHELRHVAQARRRGDRTGPFRTFRDYVNSPHEVEARVGDVVAEAVAARRRRRGTEPTIAEVLADCPTWLELEPYLTPANQRKMLRAVATAVSSRPQ